MSALQNTNGGAIRAAQLYWDSAAETYEAVFSGTTIGMVRREAVWEDMQRIFHRDDHILEINCGTGLDAVFLAQQGVNIVACDISPRMIEMAQQHAETKAVSDRIEFITLATENLGSLTDRPLFDGAFSNFSGLNCVDDLSAVRTQLSRRLKPGAPLLLCMVGRVAPWEVLWFLLGKKPKPAFQRRQQKTANIGNSTELKIHRPTVDEICRQFAPAFELRRWRGIGIAIPPSYMEHWAHRYPRLIRFFAAVDRRIGRLPIIRNMADCVILELQHRRQ